MKQCGDCGEWKSKKDFAPNRNGNASSRCKPCHRVFKLSIARKNPPTRTPEQEREYSYRRLYGKGMTLELYDLMFEAQGGMCAICGGVNASGKRLAVDHDHVTGEIRSLLCSRCNLGLGYFQDNPTLLANARSYLLKEGALP